MFVELLVGKEKDEAWKRLCQEIEATYSKGKVIKKIENWTITLDTYIYDGRNHAIRTRMRAPYVSNDGFRFKVYRKSIFSELGKFLGRQVIEIGDASFDQEFILKSNHEFKARKLFTNQKVRQLVQQALSPISRLRVEDDDHWWGTPFPKNADQLYFEEDFIIRDVKRLKSLYELFVEILEQLSLIGSVSKVDPNIVLK